MDGSDTNDDAEEQASADRIPRGRRTNAGGNRTVCLLTTLNPERGLSLALRQHLEEEVPEIDFTLEPRDRVDAIWICGYEPGHAKLVRTLREHHGDAVIVVTGREPVEEWESEVADAGADFAFSWPVAYGLLENVLRGGLPSKKLKARRRQGLSA